MEAATVEVSNKIRKQALAGLVWAIIGILFAIGVPFYVHIMGVPVLGLLLGISGRIRSAKALKLISENPGNDEHKQIATWASICAIVALVLTLLMTLRNHIGGLYF